MKTITKIKYVPAFDELGETMVYTVLDYPVQFWGDDYYKVQETTQLIPMRPIGQATIEILEEIEEA